MGREFAKKMNEEIQKRTGLWKTDFFTHAKKYIDLLNKHVEKEDNNAFKIAVQKLTSEKDAELVELFEEIELERLGIGKHEHYHEMIKKLKVKYLK